MKFILQIIILLLVIFLAIVNKRYENFLTDDMIKILSSYKYCLLTPEIKNNYNNNYCSILSEKECVPCSAECKLQNNICLQNKPGNSDLSPYPKSYYKKCSSCEQGEIPCGNCNNCGWCISGSIDNQDGNCVKTVNGTRPSNCNIDWVYEGKSYGPSGNIKPARKCFMGTNRLVSTNDYPGYNSYGCDLYNAYKKCQECSKSNKCFGLTAGPEGTGYACVQCTGSQKKANCLAPPDEGGAGCPGKRNNDKIPLNPDKNNNRICRNIPF